MWLSAKKLYWRIRAYFNRPAKCRFTPRGCWGYVDADGFCRKCGQPQDWRLEDEAAA